MPHRLASFQILLLILLYFILPSVIESIPIARPELPYGVHCCPVNETLLWRKVVQGLNAAAYKQLAPLLSYEYLLPELQLMAGLKYPSSAKRLRKFVWDLMKGSRSLKVGVVGGSISWGQGTTARGQRDWFSVLMSWLVSVSKAPLMGRNGCIPGTPSFYMVLCLDQSVDPDVDLVLVEYVFNDGMDERLKDNGIVRSKEQLVRRLMDLPGRPAVVLVQVPHVHQKDFDPFFRTSEDLEGAVSAYYDVPTVSLRDALFPLNVHRPTPGFLWHQTYNEHHPGDAGHKALADVVVHLIQETAVGLLAAPPSRVEGAKLNLPLPPPMYDGNLPPSSSACVVGRRFTSLVRAVNGWEWVNEGTASKPKWGYVATEPGSSLVVRLSQRLAAEAIAKAEAAAAAAAATAATAARAAVNATANSTAAAISATNAAVDVVPDAPDGGGSGSGGNTTTFPVLLHYLRSYTGMGTARVECGGGCGCGAGEEVDAMHHGHASQTHMAPVMVEWTDPRVSCDLHVTLLNETSSEGGHKFKVSGVVVAFGYGPDAFSSVDNWHIPGDE